MRWPPYFSSMQAMAVRKKIFVALSGGVDSSVAAALLKKRGFDVHGIHINMWSPKDSYPLPAASSPHDTVCRQQYQDRLDAMRVAVKLDIPFQTWDFTDEYRRAVVDYMIREYADGRTPNPDMMCNRHIKFGLFLKRALELGADYVATGHYVRKSETHSASSGRANPKSQIQNLKLLIAKDANKDQSYFLWTLAQKQLRHCLFPIGEYTKPEVRALARRYGLPTAVKPDSQGICFIGEINIREFLMRYIPERRGRVLTTAGGVVGEHGGAEFYTIGQRRGLGIGGGIPYYVAEKNVAANTITVAEGPYDGTLFQKELVATDVNWILDEKPKFPLRCEARIRYRQPLQTCSIERIGDNRVGVMFDESQRAITPGQSIVFYRDEEMLGGGIIA